jgi:SAM-dependent methyltransferase
VTSVSDPARIGDPGRALAAERLVAELAALDRPRIVEIGTLRSDPAFPTHHRDWAPHGEWLGVDVADGLDVDLVDDAHTLWDVGRGFDAYVACSVFEHLERPWRAMVAAGRVLRPGGLVYVQTHQTFPLHGYPRDYWRFSREALAVLADDAGLETLVTSYTYPARIEPGPEVTRWNRSPDVEAWLNVEILARARP